MTKMPSRRAAFWLCYVAILVGSSSPLFAQQTCPGTCLVAQDCQCVGVQCVDCFCSATIGSVMTATSTGE